MWNYVLFDCETGGLSHKENPITEIAFLVYDNVKFEEAFRHETFVKPYHGLKLDPQALKITGITEDMLKDGAELEDIVEIFILISKKFTISKGKWKTKPVLVGHNIADFDVPFIEYMFEHCGKSLWDYYQRYMEDTLIWSRNKWEGEYQKFNLAACCGYAGVEIIDAHRAMNDIEPNKELHKVLVESLRNKNVNFTATTEEENPLRKTFKF